MVMTTKELMALFMEVKDIYGQLHKEFAEDEKYYNLEFLDALGLPDEFRDEGTILPTAAEVVDSAVEHIATAFRQVTVPRASTSTTATERAQTLEAAYTALLNFFERSAKDNPYRMVGKHLFTYGMGAVKELYDPNKIPEEPIREDDETDEEFNVRMLDYKAARDSLVPFTLQIIHPKDIYPDPWGDPCAFVFQHSVMARGKAEKLFPNALTGVQGRPGDKVEVIEYFDETHRNIVVDVTPQVKTTARKTLVPVLTGRLVDDSGNQPHGIGRLPYSVYASGLGIDDSEHRPEKKYVGLLRKLRSTLEAESRGYSIRDIVLKGQAWPVRVAEGNTNGMTDFKLEYGVVKSLPENVKIHDLAPQTPPNDLLAHVADTTARIEKAGAPRSVRGINNPGVDTGFQTQLLLMQAKLKYGSVAEAMERLMEDVCRIFAMTLERKVDGKVKLISDVMDDGFVTISGRTVNRHYSVRVKINVSEPEDEIRKHQDAAGLVAQGIWTRQHALTKISPDVDPRRMLAGVLAENLTFSGPVMGILSQLAVQNMSESLGIEELVEQIMAAADNGANPAERAEGSPSNRQPPQDGAEGGPAGSREDQAALRALALRSQ